MSRAQVTGRLHALAEEAARTLTPIARPMWWLDPRDEATFTIHDQFALGDDLIVAPVVERGATARDIYLTQGCWRDPFAEVRRVAVWLHTHRILEQSAMPRPHDGADGDCMTEATAQHPLHSLHGQVLPLLDTALAYGDWAVAACRHRIRRGRAPAGCRASLRPSTSCPALSASSPPLHTHSLASMTASGQHHAKVLTLVNEILSALPFFEVPDSSDMCFCWRHQHCGEKERDR